MVVDNASSDETVEIAESWNGEIRVVRLDENRGFGAANNVGVRAARHEAVALLNPDTELVDDSLLRLAALALRESALCGPELLRENMTRQPSASALPAGWEIGLSSVFPAALMPRPLRLHCEPWRAERVVEVGWLTGACVAAPRPVLLELGPFDESIHLYGEDMDLGLRARSAGIRSLYAPDVARVVHFGDRSAAKRFADAGLAMSFMMRRRVVRQRLGRARERYDSFAMLTFLATRYVAKELFGRDGGHERACLRAALQR